MNKKIVLSLFALLSISSVSQAGFFNWIKEHPKTSIEVTVLAALAAALYVQSRESGSSEEGCRLIASYSRPEDRQLFRALSDDALSVCNSIDSVSSDSSDSSDEGNEVYPSAKKEFTQVGLDERGSEKAERGRSNKAMFAVQAFLEAQAGNGGQRAIYTILRGKNGEVFGRFGSSSRYFYCVLSPSGALEVLLSAPYEDAVEISSGIDHGDNLQNALRECADLVDEDDDAYLSANEEFAEIE